MLNRTIVRAAVLCGAILVCASSALAAAGDACNARARYIEGKVGGLGDASFFATFQVVPDRKRCQEGCGGTVRFKVSYTGKNGAVEVFEPTGTLEWESSDGEAVEEVATIVWPKCTRRMGDFKTTPCTLDRGYVIRVTCEQL